MRSRAPGPRPAPFSPVGRPSPTGGIGPKGEGRPTTRPGTFESLRRAARATRSGGPSAGLSALRQSPVAVIAIAGVSVLLSMVMLVVVIVGGVVSIGATNIGAPFPSATVRKEIPPQYLSFFKQAAVDYSVPWTVLAGLAAVQTDDGRFSPYDWVDYGTAIDRAPTRTSDPFCLSEVEVVWTQAPGHPSTTRGEPSCGATTAVTGSGASVPGTPSPAPSQGSAVEGPSSRATSPATSSGGSAAVPGAATTAGSPVPAIPQGAPSDYRCVQQVCGPWPPIGTKGGEGQGALLVNPGVAAEAGLNANDLRASIQFVAKKLSTARNKIQDGGHFPRWYTRAKTADGMWTQAVDELYNSGIIENPNGQSVPCTQVSGTTVSLLVQEVWTCEIDRVPAVYVVQTVDGSTSPPTYTTYPQALGLNQLVDEGLAVAKAFSNDGSAACNNTASGPAGVFPLTAAVASQFGDTTRCNAVENIDAAIRALLSVTTLPPADRQQALAPYELPGVRYLYQPMLGGWMLMPAALGHEERTLLVSGPYVPFQPTTACQNAVQTWLESLAAEPGSPFPAFATKMPSATQTNRLAGDLAGPNNPGGSPTCQGAGHQAAFLQWVGGRAAELSGVRAPTTTGPAVTTGHSGTAGHSGTTPSGTGTPSAVATPGTPSPTTRSPSATGSPSTTASGVPGTTVSRTRSSTAPGSTPTSPVASEAGPSPTLSPTEIAPTEIAAMRGLAHYFIEATSLATSSASSDYPVTSAIARLSVDGIGVAYTPPSAATLLSTSSADAGPGATVLSAALEYGGDYPGDTRKGGGGVPALAGVGGSVPGVPPGWLQWAVAAGMSCTQFPDMPYYLLAIAKHESNFWSPGKPGGGTTDSDPQPVTTGQHAEGPMQFILTTFNSYAAGAPNEPPNILTPADAMYAASKMLCADGASSGTVTGMNQALYQYGYRTPGVWTGPACGTGAPPTTSYIDRCATHYQKSAITVTSASSGDASVLVQIAETQQGLPYIWGGEEPGVGFDCSGLVDWVLLQAGLDPGRAYLGAPGAHGTTATGLYRATETATVARTGKSPTIRAGDLLFYFNLDGTGTVDHVGISVGTVNGVPSMIDAPGPTGPAGAIRIQPSDFPGFYAATNPFGAVA